MPSQSTILHIALNKPLRHCFDYLPPADIDVTQLKAGMRVQVPFGKKQMIGVLLEVNQTPCVAPEKLKPATSILDSAPLLPESLQALCVWASRYYQHPIGEVMLGALPVYLRKHVSEENKKKSNKKPFAINDNPEPPLTLDQYQKQALDTILAQTGFQAFLLEGVTGSGRTV